MVASQPSGDHSQNSSRLTSAKMPMNGKPSRCNGASWERMDARTDMLLSSFVLARLCPGHHGFPFQDKSQTWMPGTRPDMTLFPWSLRGVGALDRRLRDRLGRAVFDRRRVAVGRRRIVL